MPNKYISKFYSESQVKGILKDFVDYLDYYHLLVPVDFINSDILVEHFYKDYSEVK